MWCRACQQDVPPVAVPQQPDSLVCPRCDGALTADSAEQTDIESDDVHSASTSAATAGDGPCDWESELARMDQLLARLDIPASTSPARPAGPSAAPSPAPAPAARSGRASPQQAIAANGSGGWFSWLILSLGLMVFICGGVLVGCSMFTGSARLWQFGLPVCLLGQLGLVIGLVLHLESLGATQRRTQATLLAVGDQLQQLQHATTMLQSTPHSASQAFYVHYAQQASPHLLLADLKGQLDLLAMQLGDRD